MKHLQTFKNYSNLTEDALEVGDDSDVIVDDILLDSGEKIKSAEIIGVINTSKTEKEFKEYFAKKKFIEFILISKCTKLFTFQDRHFIYFS